MVSVFTDVPQDPVVNYRDHKSMGMAMFKRTFARTIPDNLTALRMKIWGFEAEMARKFTQTPPRTLPWNFIAMLSASLTYTFNT